jgi:hypothetical protein
LKREHNTNSEYFFDQKRRPSRISEKVLTVLNTLN